MRWTREAVEERVGPTTEEAGVKVDVGERRWAYRMAAAVQAAFDPWMLQPLGAEKQSHGECYRLLVDDCQTSFDGSEHRWRLKADLREAALQRLGSRQALLDALDRNPPRDTSDLQRYLEAYIRGTGPSIQGLDRSQLTAVLQVVQWLSIISELESSLPSFTAVKAQLLGEELLAPLQRLLPTEFHGRDAELERIHEYLDGALGPGPLVLHGPGGVGKSALLAKLVLDQTKDSTQPLSFAYLDMELTQLDVQEPVTLLKHIVLQIGLQLPVVRSRCERLLEQWSEDLAAQFRKRKERGPSPDPLLLPLKQPLYEVVTLFEQEKVAARVFVILLDTFEEAQYRGGSWITRLWNDVLVALVQRLPLLRIIVAGRADVPATLQHVSMALAGFDRAAACAYLVSRGVPTADAERVAALVGGHPLTLALAADLIQRGVGLGLPNSANVQGHLYARVLGHIRDPAVARLAHPGLALRRVTPELILQVLAGPCQVEVPSLKRAHELFELLQEEVALFTPAEDGALEHRRDLRLLMIESLERDQPEKARQIHDGAVRYYTNRPDARSRAELVYHRLRLGEDLGTMMELVDEVEVRELLRDAVEELPPKPRIQLASRLGIALPDEMLQHADQEDWERSVAERVRPLLQQHQFEKVRTLLGQRTRRLPLSPLLLLEARALEGLGWFDDATTRARRALDELRLRGGGAREQVETSVFLAFVETLRADSPTPPKALEYLKQAWVVGTGTLDDGQLLSLLVQLCETARANGASERDAEIALIALLERVSSRVLVDHRDVAKRALTLVNDERPDLVERLPSFLVEQPTSIVPTALRANKLDFSRPEIRELVDLLAATYDDHFEAELAVVRAGGEWADIANAPSLGQLWRGIVRSLAQSGHLVTLLEQAMIESPSLERRIDELFSTETVLDSATPITAQGTSITEEAGWWRGGDDEGPERIDVSDARSYPVAAIIAASQNIARVNVDFGGRGVVATGDRKSTRLNSSHCALSRMPSSA